MYTEEGPPRIAGLSDERETTNFSVGSLTSSSTRATVTDFGPISPGWKVTYWTALSKSSLSAVSGCGVILKNWDLFNSKVYLHMSGPDKLKRNLDRTQLPDQNEIWMHAIPNI